MTPFLKDPAPGLSAAPTLVADSKTGDPFSQAIDQFLAEQEDADSKNPFINKIRTAQQLLATTTHDGEQQSKVAAIDLENFVQGLAAQKQTHSVRRTLQRLTPFIGILSKLMGMCENILQAAPFGVSIAFTGARVVLGLAVQASNCLESVVDAIVEIGHKLKCYELFADAFRQSADIQELLVSSYKRIIQFWSDVSRILSAGRFKSAVMSLSTPIDKEVTAALDGLKRDADNVTTLAQATTDRQMQHERETARREQIIRWITNDSNLDIEDDLSKAAKGYQEGTCQWFFDDKRFKSWCESRDNAVLWYHANPGSGKTVLAATVVEHLKKQGQNVAYFFYSFNSPSRKQGISGLRSLALRLFHLANFVPQTLQDRIKDAVNYNMGGLRQQRTAVAVVHDLLNHGCADVCIVVDGLDECSDEGETLSSFQDLLGSETYGLVKWFFTSRNQPRIKATMDKCKAQEIKAETDVISRDIRAYFSKYIPSACNTCVARWSEGEDNFLYARLICETLRGEGLTSEDEINQALMAYPKDLNGYYMRVLEKLGGKSEREQERAR